jgi:hypothetical protein
MAKIDFNSDNVADGTSGRGRTVEPVPAGEYLVEIVKSAIRPVKSGNGKYVYLEMRIVEGPEEGRYLFDRLNYDNPNQTTQDIAQKALKRVMRWCGLHGELVDTEQLHFKRFNALVSVRKDPLFGLQNQVRYPDPPADDPAMMTVAADDQARVEINRHGPPPRAVPSRASSSGATRPWQQKPRF